MDFLDTNYKKFSIFCDESGIIKERYMVLGGIILPTKNVKRVESKIRELKEREGFADHEIKFKKLTNQKKLSFYEKVLIETYLDVNNSIEFRCVIFDTHQVNHKEFIPKCDNIHHDERGFYKQYYQLIYHQFCEVNKNGIFYCSLDERYDKNTSTVCTNELLKYLIEKTNGRVKSVQNINSKNSQLLQLSDLLVGAVACEANKRSTKPEKYQLANFIKIQIGSKTAISNQSSRNYNYFKVWRFDYTKSKKKSISERISEMVFDDVSI